MTRFVVVTDTPSAYNAGEGRLLAKSAAKLLGASMAAAGFAREDFTMFPQSRCPYNKDEFTTKEQKAIRDHCRGYLDDFLKASTPEAIIPLGAEPARQVLGRAVKITKVRGVIEHSQEYGTKVFPMLNPGMVLMYPQHRVTFDMDCIALRDLAEVSYRLKVRARRMLGDYEFIDDLQFLVDAEPDTLFYDTETTGLSFFAPGTHDVRDYDPSVHGKEFAPRPAVLTLQFAIEPEKSYMLVWDHPENPVPLRRKRRLREQLRLLLNNPKTRVVGQNAKYDRVFTESCLGVSYPIGGDTLMLATLLDENAISKGQDMLVRQYVQSMAGYADAFNATYDKSRMWEIPLSELISYGCGDTDSGYRLHTVLYDMVRKDRKLLAHYVRVTLPGLNAFAAIEQRGMYVDEAALDVFESVVAQDVEERYQSLISQVPRSIKRAHVEKGLKFSRGDFIRDILFYHKDGFRLTPKVFTQTTAKLPPDRRVASTSSKNHLPYFYDTHPFTYELTEYIQSERLLGTNIRGFKKKYIVDGLVRPTYSLWTAVTGRSACVRADTPVVTSRGTVRADAIRVGDRVFTHAYRWKPVTALFRKDPVLMYDVYLSNGEVLPVTAHHRVMLDSGLWADIGYILEGLGYVISQQATDAEPIASTSCSDDVYTGRSIQYAEGYEIPIVKTGGEKPAVQDAAVFRLRGWEGVPNPPRDVGVASGYTRQVLGPRRGITIEKVVCAGVHRVYDFEVADDHSYLACGVFNHNSENPNGQNIPKRGKLAKAYRRSFIAPRGYLVIEADLSQAELRIAASMANEATMLSVYRNAGDIHAETALIALGITRTKFKELPKAEQKSARQKAKAVNFGFCIAEGQRVLTHVGLVPIEDIQDWHRVWDGVEWVTHQGLVCRGEQEVITHDGLTATPDHEVFTEGHSDPVRLGDCASSLEKRRIVVSGDASHPVRVIVPDRAVREARAQPTLLRSGVLRVRRVTLDIGGQYLVRQDYELQMSDEEVPSRCAGRDSWAEIRCYGATVREVDTQEFETLQRTRYSRVVSDETEFHRVGINEVAFGDLQGQGLRPDQQRRRLLSREFTAGLAFGESKEPAEKETGTPRKVRVYDLIDAGPRRRFTVEGRLVSNCYGMGWRKFIGYAKTQYGVEFTDEEAQRIRIAFFKKYSGLSSWHERQRQAAMRDGQVRSYSGRIRHLPMIYSDDEMVQQEAGRQSINSPVQEFASSLGVMAIGRLSAEIDPQYLAPIAFVHDAIFCYVKEEYLEWGAKTLKWYMESNPLYEWFGLRMPCPIVADVSFGRNFGDTFEMEGLVLDQPYDFTRFETSDDGGPTIYVPEQYDPPNYGLLPEIDK